jgi:hypothetical protein
MLTVDLERPISGVRMTTAHFYWLNPLSYAVSESLFILERGTTAQPAHDGFIFIFIFIVLVFSYKGHPLVVAIFFVYTFFVYLFPCVTQKPVGK